MGPTRHLLSKPVIAAVEGHAVAGGLELALWCDLRVASETRRFGVFCRRWGVPLIDGGTVRLPRLIGQGRALDMILTGREVGAREAFDWASPTGWCRPARRWPRRGRWPRQLAKFPQLCLRSDRRSSYEQWSLDSPSALVNEARLRRAGPAGRGALRRRALRRRQGPRRQFRRHRIKSGRRGLQVDQRRAACSSRKILIGRSASARAVNMRAWPWLLSVDATMASGPIGPMEM